MQNTLFAFFIALLMVGCGESSQPSEGLDMTDPAPKKDAIETAVDLSKLEGRNGVTYLADEETPFTSRAESFHDNEQKEYEANYKDGKRVDENLLLPGKKIHFKFRDGEGPTWTASFFENGIVIHSARPKGTYRIKGLTAFVVDAEPVKLVFKKPNIAVGDVFCADSPSTKETLFFKILKVEALKRSTPNP